MSLLMALSALVATDGPMSMTTALIKLEDQSCGFTVEQIWEGALVEARSAALSRLSAAAPEVADRCRKSWKDQVDRMADHESAYVSRICRSHRPHVGRASERSVDCWANRTGVDWKSCCRNELGPSGNASCFSPNLSFERCCTFSERNRNHDSLPALYEISLTVETSSGWIVLSQDGFLRPFDVGSVLWPSGYLLTLFVSNAFCASIKGKRVLELGAGVGGPSIASAKCGAAAVLATDRAFHSRLLIAANAARNGVVVDVLSFDWLSEAELALLVARGPWDVVIGAAILVESWMARMWLVLEALLRSGRESGASTNGSRTVLLAHTAGVIEPPVSSSFRISSRVPSEQFGMRNRFSGTSDFEVVEIELLPSPHDDPESLRSRGVSQPAPDLLIRSH